MVSLVVPGISVTIALDSLSKTFINEDFPTLGLPTMEMAIPSLSILPVSAESIRISISSFIDDIR